MRIAIVSDIHGNLTAFEAVLADLKETSPDLVLHGGDLAHSGARPVEVIDRIRALGWDGILGNTDEMLFWPDSLTIFAAETPAFQPLAPRVAEMAEWTAKTLGPDRLAWLAGLPKQRSVAGIAIIHASPESIWRAPLPDASDDELRSSYSPLGTRTVVYAHIHRSYVRNMDGLTVANTGSVSLSQDGDPRASYLLADGPELSIRRVEYDIAGELAALQASGLPYAEWVGRCIAAGRFQNP